MIKKRTVKRAGIFFAGILAASYMSFQALSVSMNNNKVVAKERMAEHKAVLYSYLEAGRLNEHPAFVKFIDNQANPIYAMELIAGITNMYSSIDGTIYKIKCVSSTEMQHYGYVYKAGYPVIHFCNLFDYMVNGGDWWFYHEMSHFNPPYGLATNDEVGPSGEPYSMSDALYFARTMPEVAMDNAFSIEQFLRTEPPKPLNTPFIEEGNKTPQ